MKPAVLSFLLPGLGQVYQKRFWLGGLLFVFFVLACSFSQLLFLMPLLVVLSSWEARTQMKKFQIERKNERVEMLYNVIAIVGFATWIGLYAPCVFRGCFPSAWASPPPPQNPNPMQRKRDPQNIVEGTAETLDKLVKKQSFIAMGDPWTFQGLPLIFATGNTGFNLGVRTMFTDIRRQDPHQFLFEAQLLSSDRGRYKHFLRLDAPRLFDGKYRAGIRIAYDRDMALRYFGIGNETGIDRTHLSDTDPFYQNVREGPSLSFSFFKRFGRYFSTGPLLQLKWTTVTAFPGTQLANDSPVGIAGGRTHQIGWAFVYNRLDFEPYPTSGDFHEIFLGFSNTMWGSDYNFFRGTYTFKKFYPLQRKLTLANRLLVEGLYGDTPFYELGAVGGGEPTQDFGGGRFLRGYFGNEYIDKLKAAFGTELRWDPIQTDLGGQMLKLGLVQFIDIGRVWQGVPWPLDRLHISTGWGVRFIWNNRFVLRADYILNPEQSMFVVDIGSSF